MNVKQHIEKLGREQGIAMTETERIRELEEKNKHLREYILKLRPKHRHDHEYFHDDCSLCQIEKREYAKTKRVLNGE